MASTVNANIHWTNIAQDKLHITCSHQQMNRWMLLRDVAAAADDDDDDDVLPTQS